MNVLSICASAALLSVPVSAAPQLTGVTRSQAPAPGRGVAAFPMDLSEANGPLGSYGFTPRALEFASLMDFQTLSMPGVPIPGGESITLDLERVDFDFSSLGVHVNGEKAAWDSGDLTLWTGSVLGDPFSEVTIGFSSLGTYGWIATGGETWHVGANAGLAGDWSTPGCRLWAESVSASLRDASELPQCLSEGL